MKLLTTVARSFVSLQQVRNEILMIICDALPDYPVVKLEHLVDYLMSDEVGVTSISELGTLDQISIPPHVLPPVKKIRLLEGLAAVRSQRTSFITDVLTKGRKSISYNFSGERKQGKN